MAMNIFEHIEKEHREVEGLLEQLSSSYDRSTYDRLNQSLQAHMKAEEESLYPAMEGQESEMIQQARREHDEVRQLLQRLKQEGGAQSVLSQLTQAIEGHVQKEEGEMFSRARDMFDQGRIEQLSQRFEEVDQRVIQQIR
ncbi:MAG TPA: hemerythrin domain-containing protein [Methanomassiliicoccaceae archaeon]|jgi:iron-sulfur cluster repair protein YtfE (RIC family)|nr:hemerythrin domain-containing protein [Methanomassiliicoccaceae archaeon]HOK27698.1 hemerythrin domain-containing protein [Methanomassiliicoccaceae archaeon]HOQ25507.1 hemerythrin domain-containing protein [Methanomassiliicoccaceae archaeon]HPP44433.1 hemerythrin domain-containing protein [Methanomassiliicoccaceae archaeon]HPT73342.1 hemerythrin domain-containing protein [Methanomassiliicoccaceae archaeon]